MLGAVFAPAARPMDERVRRFVLWLMRWYDERAAADRQVRSQRVVANAIRVRRKREARSLASYRRVQLPRR